MRGRGTLGAVLVALALPAASSASPAPDGTAFLVPTNAGSGSHLHIDAKGPDAGLTPKEIPQALGVAFQKGFAFDPAAVPGSCSDQQMKDNACPADSTVANGAMTGRVTGLGFGADGSPFDAAVTLYKAPPRQDGDPAGLVFAFHEQNYNFSGAGPGRLQPLPDDPTYGMQMRFDKLPLPDLPPGITVTIEELRLDIGAGSATPAHSPTVARHRHRHPCRKGHKGRKCRRKRRRERRRHRRQLAQAKQSTGTFLANPPTCAGNWTVQLQLDYPAHSERREASVPCAQPA